MPPAFQRKCLILAHPSERYNNFFYFFPLGEILQIFEIHIIKACLLERLYRKIADGAVSYKYILYICVASY